jgi:5-methylcytosine-specific restriction endonuclease McrA
VSETAASKNSPGGNPRKRNGNFRRKAAARFRAMAAPCGICGGRLGPIRYDQPSDGDHPLSFVIDEIRPISKWMLFGYDSPEAAAQDWNNLQAAHRCCNAAKGARAGVKQEKARTVRRPISRDGEW